MDKNLEEKFAFMGLLLKSQMPNNYYFVNVGVGELQSIFKRVALFYEEPGNFNIIITNLLESQGL